MVEFVLVVIALTPIFVLTPMVNKTADANLASAQAARYGAWEQTVTIGGKEGTILSDEINNRFYTEPDAPIRTNQAKLTGEDQQNLFWGGAGLEGRLVDTAENDVLSVEVEARSVAGSAAVAASIVSTLGSLNLPDSEWGLDGGGIREVTVALNISDAALIDEDLQGETCQNVVDNVSRCMRQKSAILTDTWGARGPDQVARRVRSLVPAAILQPVGDAISNVGTVLPMFQELKKLDGIFGEVKPDILPPDRYGEEEQ